MWDKIKGMFKMEPDSEVLAAQLVLLESDRLQLENEIAMVKSVIGNAIAEESGSDTEETVEPEPGFAGRGVRYPDVAFVGASPSLVDSIRDRPFSGIVGKTLEEEYILKTGLSMDRVYITNIVKSHCTNDNGKGIDPTDADIQAAMPEFVAEMEMVGPRFIVALGKKAHKFLGDTAEEWVPHPRAMNILGNSGEVERKLTRLIKKLDEPAHTFECQIINKHEDQKLVTSVVMEPMENDTDFNWTTVEEIEGAAHFFLKNFRAIDTEHSRKDIDAAPVESWITREDPIINGTPVKAGTWLMTVKVENDDEWSKVVSGEYGGFSIDAFTKINPNALLP